MFTESEWTQNILHFLRLFLEKIRQHPDFASVSVSDRALNAQKLREVLPKAEKLKSRLLEQYTHEYKQYYEEQVNFFLFCYFYL
jgi:STAM-binding protein